MSRRARVIGAIAVCVASVLMGCGGPGRGVGTAVLPASGTTATFAADELLSIGRAALDAGDLVTALAAARQLLALGASTPFFCDASLLEGDVLLKQEDFVGSRDSYRRVIAACPARAAEALLRIGDSFRAQFTFVHGDDTGVIPIAPSADVERVLLRDAIDSYAQVEPGPFRVRALIKKALAEATTGTAAGQAQAIADLEAAAGDPAATPLEIEEALFRQGLVHLARTALAEAARQNAALGSFNRVLGAGALAVSSHAQSFGLGPSFFPGLAQLEATLAFVQREVLSEADGTFQDQAFVGRSLARFFGTSDFEGALAECRAFLAAQPGRFPSSNSLDLAHFFAAESLRLLGRFDEALGEYNLVGGGPLRDAAQAGVAQVLLVKIAQDRTRAARPFEFAANLVGIARDVARRTGTPFSAGIKSANQLLNALAGEGIPVPPTLIQGLPPRRAVAGVPYRLAPSVVGGVPPLAFSATGLPPGVAIDGGTGVLSGSAAAAGKFAVDLTVRDAAGDTDQRSITLVVQGLSIATPPQLPVLRSGVAYATALRADGGTPPFTWRLAEGALPAGFTLDPETGVIRSPALVEEALAATLARFHVVVTDAAGSTAQSPFVLAGAVAAPIFPGPASASAARSAAVPAGSVVPDGRAGPRVLPPPSVQSFPTGAAQPLDLALTADGTKAYVGHAAASLTEVDVESGALRALPLAAPATGDLVNVVVLEPPGGRACVVAVPLGGEVIQLAFPGGGAPARRAFPGETVLRAAATPDRRRLLVVTDRALHVLDAFDPAGAADRVAALDPAGAVDVVDEASALRLSGSIAATDRRALVANGRQPGPRFFVFDCDLDTLAVRRIEAPDRASACLLAPDGKTGAVIGPVTRELSLIDLEVGTTSRLTLADRPLCAALSPDGRTAVVGHRGRGSARPVEVGPRDSLSREVLLFSAALVDPANGTVSGEFLADALPFDVAVAPDGRRFALAEREADFVQVVEVPSLSATRYAVGAGPVRLTIAPGGGRIVGVSRDASTLFRIRLDPPAGADSQPRLARAPLPKARVGVPYAAPDGAPVRLAGRGGSGTYRFSEAAGGEPAPGLTLAADGTLAGTPSRAGLYTFAAALTDPDVVTGGVPASDRRDVRILVEPAGATASDRPPLVFLPERMLVRTDRDAATPLPVVGGTPPFEFDVVGAADLDLGLTLSRSGLVTAVSASLTRGRSTRLVRARDAAGRTSTGALEVEVADVTTIRSDAPVAIQSTITQSPGRAAAAPASTVSDIDLFVDVAFPPPPAGEPRARRLDIGFSAGLSINSAIVEAFAVLNEHGLRTAYPGIRFPAESLGLLAGAALSSTFALQAVDGNGLARDTGAVVASWKADVNRALRIRSASLPAGLAGQTYGATVTATGGLLPLAFSAAGLPSGLMLAGPGAGGSHQVRIAGTPAAASEGSVAITATDAAGQQVTANLRLAINATAGTPAPDRLLATFAFPGLEGVAVAPSAGILYIADRASSPFRDDALHEVGLADLVGGASGPRLAVRRSAVVGRGVRMPALAPDESRLFLPSDDNANDRGDVSLTEPFAKLQEILLPQLEAAGANRADRLGAPVPAEAAANEGRVVYQGSGRVRVVTVPVTPQGAISFNDVFRRITSLAAMPGASPIFFADGADRPPLANDGVRVRRFNAANGTILDGGPGAPGHGGLAVHPDGSRVIFASADPVTPANGQIQVLDAATLLTIDAFPAPGLVAAGTSAALVTVQIGITPDGRHVFCPANGGVLIADLALGTTTTLALPGFTTPHQCVVAADGRTALVASRADQRLAVLVRP